MLDLYFANVYFYSKKVPRCKPVFEFQTFQLKKAFRDSELAPSLEQNM